MRFSIYYLPFLWLGICLAGWVPVKAQTLAESAVPVSVRSSFSQSNPGIKASWSKSGGGYEAGFSKQGKQYAYVYSAAGQLQLKKLAFSGSTLPEPVKGKVAGRYSLAEVSDAWQVMNRDKQTYYEVFVSAPDSLTRLRYSASGQLLSKASKAQASPAVATKENKESSPAVVATTPKVDTKPSPPVASKPTVAAGATQSQQPAVAMRGESAVAKQPVKTEIYEEDYEFEADLTEEEEVEEVFEDEDLVLPDDEDEWDLEEDFEEEQDIDSIGTDEDDL